MHLLVTRPEADARELIDLLEADGHEVSHYPLLDIVFRKQVKLYDKRPQAVLITSANGARGLARQAQMAELSDVLAITLGPASTRAAQEAGFGNIDRTSRGDVRGTIDYVRQHLRPQDGALLYASGSKTTGDLVGELQQDGFDVAQVVLYDALPATQLPENICQFVRQGELDGVLLFSPRTAKIWLSLTNGCFSDAEMAKIKHYCLSENVAKMIDRSLDRGLGRISDTIICDKPDTSGMLQAIRTAVGESTKRKNLR